MAFDRGDASVDVSSKSVVLMTLDISRAEESRHELNPLVVHVERPGARSKADRQNFKLDSDLDRVRPKNGPEVYLLRMALEPGPYRLIGVSGDANAFPFVATFIVPVLGNLAVPPNSVIYIGRVTAVLRPRRDGEFRAGPLLPLIDQAAAGLSSGTFDVTIANQAGPDIALFRSTFPALNAATIETAPLPPFDRAAVQLWWEEGEDAGDAGSAVGNPRSRSPL